MVESIVAAGVPAAISNSAGTFLCNHVAYGVLHAIAHEHLTCLAGFVHLPYLPEQAATKPNEVASMSLQTMLAGLRAALPAVARACEAARPLEGVGAR
jgi:pyroglutamyl-peptidase